jgi:hypothetical protein
MGRKMYCKSALLGAVATLLAVATTQANATTYDISITDNGYTETGEITTNGTLGTLTKSDITSWSFTLVGPGSATHGPTDISSSAGVIFSTGTSLTATANGLFFNFGSGGAGWTFQNSGDTAFIELSSNGFTEVDYIWGSNLTQSLSGNVDIGVAATPLPAALPLFAGGLGALGLLGWRRKRAARSLAV